MKKVIVIALASFMIACSGNEKKTSTIEIRYISGDRDTVQLVYSNLELTQNACIWTGSRYLACGVRDFKILK